MNASSVTQKEIHDVKKEEKKNNRKKKDKNKILPAVLPSAGQHVTRQIGFSVCFDFDVYIGRVGLIIPCFFLGDSIWQCNYCTNTGICICSCILSNKQRVFLQYMSEDYHF